MKGGIHMKAKTLIVMAACMAIGLCASGCQNSMTQTAVAQEDQLKAERISAQLRL